MKEQLSTKDKEKYLKEQAEKAGISINTMVTYHVLCRATNSLMDEGKDLNMENIVDKIIEASASFNNDSRERIIKDIQRVDKENVGLKLRS